MRVCGGAAHTNTHTQTHAQRVVCCASRMGNGINRARSAARAVTQPGDRQGSGAGHSWHCSASPWEPPLLPLPLQTHAPLLFFLFSLFFMFPSSFLIYFPFLLFPFFFPFSFPSLLSLLFPLSFPSISPLLSSLPTLISLPSSPSLISPSHHLFFPSFFSLLPFILSFPHL